MSTRRSRRFLTATALVSAFHQFSPANAQTLVPEVRVVAPRPDGPEATTAGPTRGYQALTATSATRTDTPIEQIPQAIQVIPRRVLDDQGITTQSDAFRNVSSVVPLDTRSFGQQFPFVRGFSADRLVDGLPNYYDGGARDLTINVERIEVLKGPSAILYPGAANAISGVINVVSKMPTATPSIFTGFRLGTNGYSPFFDLNAPLNKEGTVLFRVTGQFDSQTNSINVYRRQSFAINPTLTFTNNETTSLTIQGAVSRSDHRDYPGLPAVGTLDRSAFTIRPNLWPSSLTVPSSYVQNQSVTLRFDHKFNDVWSTQINARYGTSKFSEPAQFPFPSNTPFFGSGFSYFNAFLGEETTQASINGSVLARFDVGMTRNKLLLSSDYDRVTDNGRLGFGLASFVPVDLAVPNPILPVHTMPTFFGLNARNVYTNAGATAQLQTSIQDRLHLLGAVRVANVQTTSDNLNTLTRTGNNTTRVLPRIGAAFEVLPGATLFANYSEGLRALPVFTGTALRPEESRQYEGGLKLNLASTLTATFTVFDLTKRNVAVPDPLNPFAQIQTGQQRSQGAEIDVVWQPTRNWSFLASYSNTYARVTRDTAIAIGTPLAGVPRDAARLWGNYRFTEGPLDGLSIGAGLYAQSPTRVALAEPYNTPAFVTIDAKVAYEYRNWTISLTGRNLADQRYFVRYPYFSGTVAPGERRSGWLTVSAKF